MSVQQERNNLGHDPDRQPTIVELFQKNWYIFFMMYAFWLTIFYYDSRDGYMEINKGMPADEFLPVILPIFFLSLVPYIVMVYFYPKYIEGVKKEILNNIIHESYEPRSTGDSGQDEDIANGDLGQDS